jgi:hypothetical protein
MEWIDGGGDRPICWFSGPAGFGKSAVAQAIADQCDTAHTLAASFFFSRGAGSRARITGLIPTLSYQLTLSIPDTKSSIQDILQSDPTIPYQSLEDQFQKLIVNPVRTLNEPIGTMVIVIDALDECDDKAGIEQFIENLLRASRDLPFLFFMTGRAENHIIRWFAPPEIHSTTYCLALQEFDAHRDIHKFLQSRFSTILRQNPRLFQGVQPPWPSVEDVERLVEKSSGLFIFASTLVDFVTDGRDAPQEKLKSVLSTHAGLDPLYKQVFSAAPAINCFGRVIGTIMLVRDQLSIDAIGRLLQITTAEVLQTLLAIQSILSIPDGNDEPVRILHASLRDFLTDKKRSGDYFIDPPIRHTSITADCLKIMTEDAKENKLAHNEATLYACQNWCHHLHAALIEEDKTHLLNSMTSASLTSYLQNFKSQSIGYWVNTLLHVPNSAHVINSLEEIILCLKQLRNCPRGLREIVKAVKKIAEKGSIFASRNR